MTRNGAFGALLVLGAGWGTTMPLSKTAVSSGYGHFGLVFWQLAIGAIFLGLVQLVRRRPFPLTRRTFLFCLFIAVAGTVLPNSVSYMAFAQLPAGVMALVVALVPMAAFPIALALGMDDFAPRRLLGLLLGLSAMALIALPDASLPAGTAAIWVLIALVAPLCYAFEGNVVAKYGTADLGPIQTLLGSSCIGALIALPLALGTGQFIVPAADPGPADWAILGIGMIHAMVYSGYVWLVRQTGSVFAAQVSYLVTCFGIVWSMVFLAERYPATIWIAFGLLMAGLMLVQPRLAPAAPVTDDAARPG